MTARPATIVRRFVMAVLATVGCAALSCARPVAAQGPVPHAAWWGWDRAGNPTTSWDPRRVSEYLLTGQPPHPAVARIVAPEDSGTSLGSGVLVDVNRSQGLVLTNWHVVRDSRSALLVQFPDGFQSAGTVVRWDEAWDLAAVVIWKPHATPIALAPEPPAIGEPLTIAGFGRGAYREETGPCTEYLSPGRGYEREFVELQATARQGDSGGPIFNERRELAGVLFGQNDGRTIGSCSTRLRTFLSAVGSRGFTPTPIAEFSTARALDRGLGTTAEPPTRLASMTGDAAVQRSAHVAGLPLATVPSLGSGPQTAAAPAEDLATLLNPVTNGSALLTAAGGLALFVLGLRVTFRRGRG